MDEYIAFLEEDDEASRPSRAQRLALIVGEFGEARGLLFPGGVVAMTAFEEARHSYVRGLYMATVLLAQTSLEHMLAGLLHIGGQDGRWGFAEILDLAHADRLISTDERDLFNRLRALRNPYVHARLPGAPGSLAARAVDGVQDHELMEEDATLAITALLRLVRRRPFTPGA
jgi:HEPN domain-containing protein